MFILLSIAILFVVPPYSKQEFIQCERDYKKIGCFKKADSLLTDMLITDRDLESQYTSNVLIDWHSFENSTHRLACSCSKIAREKNYKYFGIRYYGECYGGNKREEMETLLTNRKYGTSNNCLNGRYVACNHAAEGECIGQDTSEYIYDLTVQKYDKVVHGGFGNWSEFTQCSVSCGQGFQTRERDCNNPKPFGDGSKDCKHIGEYTQTRSCMVRACAVDGGFSGWTEYSECSTTCGKGIKVRTRTCTNPKPSGEGAKDCVGSKTESVACTNKVCIKDCGCTLVQGDGIGGSEMNIGKKANLHECIVACIKLQKTIHPTINGVTIPMKGSVSCYCELGMTGSNGSGSWKTCQLNRDGKYSAWTTWSGCSTSCGGGKQTRSRRCNNPSPSMKGKNCIGSSTESRDCNTIQCEYHGCIFKKGDGSGGSEVNIGTKSSHIECIKACEQLQKTTHPNINGVTIPMTGRVSCYCELGMTGSNGSGSWKTCPIKRDGKYTSWSGWSGCSKTCGSGSQKHTRSCTNPSPSNDGKDCSSQGSRVETRSCNTIQCEYHGCNFRKGDGSGGSEMNIGTKSSHIECITACVKLQKTTHPTINGVTIPMKGRVSCYCELGMTGSNGSGSWKTCQLKRDGKYSTWSTWSQCSKTCGSGSQKRTRSCNNPSPASGGMNCNNQGSNVETRSCNAMQCEYHECTFRQGDGSGGTEINIGTKSSHIECIKACIQLQKTTHPKINGVTIPMKGSVSCYCELGMTGSNGSGSWKTCAIKRNGKYSTWSAWTQCSATCGGGLQKRTRSCNNPSPSNGGKACSNQGSSAETRSCNPIQCEYHGCNFKKGDGSGGSEMNIGTKSSHIECIKACVQLQKTTHPTINGVTIPMTGSVSCYCELGMTGSNGSGSWKTCPIKRDGKYAAWSSWSGCSKTCGNGSQKRTRSCTNPSPSNGGKACSNQGSSVETRSCNPIQCEYYGCNFRKGDGSGGSEMNIGTKSSHIECIKACIKLQKTTHPTINGVTIPMKGRVSCYCELEMTGSNGSGSWKTCPIKRDGKYTSWSAWSGCSKTCGKGSQKRTRSCTKPSPSNGGKACSNQGPSVELRSCNPIQCEYQGCNFRQGDGSGGSEMNIGTKSSHIECIKACIQLQKTTHPKINGVTIPMKGSVSCYCELGMTGSNGSGSWKTCRLH